METQIIDGRKIREEILKEIQAELKGLSFQPVFCDVLVGEDPASKQYVEMKAKTAERIGIKFHSAKFTENISLNSLIKAIKDLKNIPQMCGIIVQLPLPKKFENEKQKILDAVAEELDVDCLSTTASQKFYLKQNKIGFPAALACLYLLDQLAFDWQKKKIVILGQGDLVGKPVGALLQFRGLQPIFIHSKTENREALLQEADVIISGMGRGKFLTGEMLKKGVVIIDAGTSESNAGLVGDVDLESVKGVASYVSPVPGGVGPVTVAMLLRNVLEVAKRKDFKP